MPFPNYAPEFRFTLNGSPLPPAMQGCVSSISYEDGMDGADRVEITLANPNLQWLNDSRLAMDTELRLSIGYAPDPLEEVFVGEITGCEPSFPNGGMPVMKIVAHDFLERLKQGQSERAFYVKTPVKNFPIPDVAVAAIVSGENALIPYPDPVGGVLSVLMSIAAYLATDKKVAQAAIPHQNSSDFEFLDGLAKANGWQMYIDHTLDPHGYILRFQFLIQDYSPTLTLTWGASLSEFAPKITTVGDIGGVSVRIWVSSIKMEFILTAGWDFDRAALNFSIKPGIGNLAQYNDKTAKTKTVEVGGTGFIEAPKKILSELLPRLNNRITGSGSTIGTPAMRAGRVVDIEGIGDTFSGLWRLTSTTHTLDSSGYRTSFEARREVWFGAVPLPKSPSGFVRVNGQSIR
ncbi:MAG TPA: hypothetical protein VHE81_11830 [Lacipirellulaceae bacterium]|nr:hypothetical protein [Lacipirellulaceae bacterium]